MARERFGHARPKFGLKQTSGASASRRLASRRPEAHLKMKVHQRDTLSQIFAPAHLRARSVARLFFKARSLAREFRVFHSHTLSVRPSTALDSLLASSIRWSGSAVRRSKDAMFVITSHPTTSTRQGKIRKGHVRHRSFPLGFFSDHHACE